MCITLSTIFPLFIAHGQNVQGLYCENNMIFLTFLELPPSVNAWIRPYGE